VGRLDLDSEGLLILTNDGDLALRLTHPRFKIDKEYEVLLDRPYDAARDTPKLLHGVKTESGRAKADHIRQMNACTLRITLRQGLKRQIRLMLYRVGYEVKRLVRFRIGSLRLVDLAPGQWRMLTAAEVKDLRTERPEPKPRPVLPAVAKALGEKEKGLKPRTKRRPEVPAIEKRPAKKELGRKPKAKRGAAGRSREERDQRPQGGAHRRPPARKGGFRPRDSAASAPKAARRP
jgi:23S rRNA pseudouridine2605 synthase